MTVKHAERERLIAALARDIFIREQDPDRWSYNELYAKRAFVAAEIFVEHAEQRERQARRKPSRRK